MKNRKKKDILFLCQFFYPEYVSSATLPFQTALAYAKAGYKVGALCGYPKEYSDKKVRLKEKIRGIEIKRLKYLQLERSNFLGRLINYFSFTFAALLNVWRMKDYKYVIVYSNPPVLPIVALLGDKLFHTKIIFVAYDLYPEIAIKTGVLDSGSIISKVMRWINKELYSKAYKVVALSSEMKEFMRKNRKIDPDKIVIIPNWDTTVRSKNDGHKNRFEEEYKGKIVISYLGNMGTCQDMETLIGAIRELKDEPKIQFLFAGHGNKKENLKEIVKREQLKNVKILDFLQGKDFEDALEISTCSVVSLEKGLVGLCVPSKTYSYIEAGIPIIAIMEESDITRELKIHKNGIRIINGDERTIINFLLRLLNDLDFAQELKKAAIRKREFQELRKESLKIYITLIDETI